MTKKTCENVACSMRGTKIETDLTECISCGRELKTTVADLFPGDFGDLLGGLFNDQA